MEKIPTVEEFLKREDLPIDMLSGDDINFAMIEFAKLHVKAALEDAKKRYLYDEIHISQDPEFLASSILEAYPEQQIQ